MNEMSNPGAVHAPLGAYSHTAKVPGGSEWLVVAGQVGIDAGGTLASGAQAQAAQAYRNILECLAEHGMDRGDLVKFTVFLTDARFIEDYRAARREVIGDDHRPPSTLLIVQGLAAPDIVVEIEAFAAKTP